MLKNEKRLSEMQTRADKALAANIAAGITTPPESSVQFGADMHAKVSQLREMRQAREQAHVRGKTQDFDREIR